MKNYKVISIVLTLMIFMSMMSSCGMMSNKNDKTERTIIKEFGYIILIPD